MNSLSDQSKKKKSSPKFQNFLEAFKDASGSQSKTQPAAGIQDGGFNFEEFLNQQENKIRSQERMHFEAIRREEQVIFSRDKQEIKTQIATLQIQIKELAKEHIGLIEEVDKAAFQAVVNPGIYHKNFFERLIQLIKLAKKKIADSRTWLQMHNHRSQCKSAYWQGVTKGGTSFMLSADRTAATQAG
ncbi:MAG: DUF5660 domain-containing protein [Candidatus Beckwithbacteria bacterium]|nr:DUF5660 domain-containing protein [Candidatus Beckwithbacteria bacterium]